MLEVLAKILFHQLDIGVVHILVEEVETNIEEHLVESNMINLLSPTLLIRMLQEQLYKCGDQLIGQVGCLKLAVSVHLKWNLQKEDFKVLEDQEHPVVRCILKMFLKN